MLQNTSVRIIQCLASEELRNLYGFKMLEFLRNYPEGHSNLVQMTFSDNEAFDSAIRCYIHHTLTQEEHKALEELRRFAGAAEGDEDLMFFCGAAQMRTARLLRIPTKTIAFLRLWLTNSASIISAWKTLYSRYTPVFPNGENDAAAAVPKRPRSLRRLLNPFR